MKNKIPPSTKELIHRILQLCLKINNETEHVAFFNYSGHVNSIGVNIGINKANYNKKIIEELPGMYVSSDPTLCISETDINKRLQKLIKELEELF